MSLGIGSTVWRYDMNYRRYVDPLPGERYSRGAPIWIKHWRPEKIASETSRSWVTTTGLKIPKKHTPTRFDNFATSEADIRRRQWIEEHRYRVSELIQRCDDGEVLERIAGWLGYKPEMGEVDK